MFGWAQFLRLAIVFVLIVKLTFAWRDYLYDRERFFAEYTDSKLNPIDELFEQHRLVSLVERSFHVAPWRFLRATDDKRIDTRATIVRFEYEGELGNL